MGGRKQGSWLRRDDPHHTRIVYISEEPDGLDEGSIA
jgi:hypothetical protein